MKEVIKSKVLAKNWTFNEIKQAVVTSLQGEVAEAISEMLNTATIDFGGNKNENTERSLGGESHKKLTPNETKNSNEEE